MKNGYPDIVALADLAHATPLWWDENGVPRFSEHGPRLCPDIYAREVVLLVVSCQECGREFPVQMSSGQMDQVRARMMQREFRSLEQQVRDCSIHYGDPPRHDHLEDPECFAGDTMNCIDVRVVEFWRHDAIGIDFERVRDLEVKLS